MSHVIAVLGFSVVCALLYWLQRFAGGAAGASCDGGGFGCRGCDGSGRSCGGVGPEGGDERAASGAEPGAETVPAAMR
jgi:hypothetical protein